MNAPAPTRTPPLAPSLRRRLIVRLLGLAAMLAILLSVAVRYSAERASQETLDKVLGVATASIADDLRSVEGGAEVNLPPETFSMLAAMGEERVFYRILVGGETLTGYEDLPLPGEDPTAVAPVLYSRPYRGAELRLAAVSRSLVIDGASTSALVVLGQTRDGQRLIAGQLANRAAALGLMVFLLAIPASLLAASSLLRPLDRLAEAMTRRGPRDLRPVRHPVPAELSPLIGALNSFIARLKATLAQTETFIAEAAHHIRTPLATLRSEVELALRLAKDEPMRQRLRRLLRTVDEGARSASQLLDHATVLYRTEQQVFGEVDLGQIALGIVDRYRATADLRDIRLHLAKPAGALPVTGDAVLLEAALRNLIDNAVKYSPMGSDIRISLEITGEGHVAFRCRDQGRGLAGSDALSLQARFQRGRNVDDVVGSGLGLTIVTEVADAMNGRFDLQDQEGGGTCATLLLPLATPTGSA
ncbi:HAMP domain-containing protein [Microvirga tunisiensis]|uniref:histidine kinase n=1 Tax=Pannonibacter tanglangensis TaxID=2750084 RepID=A0A7X5F0R0_9HYPH|nr:sensor histidine kinase [Pannonibacter sp. XCT-53]NBN77631.1 HAMP domain-containing protein [Pannonibacter sp. XCT-53]